MKTPELLAPAGSPEALHAAFCAGADAVYLGGAAFGARASACFDDRALEAAVKKAHLFSRRVYVTVNTLIKQSEWDEARKTLAFLCSIGVDAVLVQDAGLMTLIASEFPLLPIHASTQMSVHNARGAALLRACGARRVVLARECSLDTIRNVCQTGIETEVFCHGALCVCHSGQCAFSSSLGRRSGNRGRCGQPCRLPYTLDGQTAYWLSPRDLCTRDDLPALMDAGAASLKIEGRLKRPEYVYTVASAYRKALDAAAEGRFAPSDTNEKRALLQAFNRGGFTRGYAFDAQDAAVMNPGDSANEGLPLGMVARVYEKGGALLADILLTNDLHDGDGLRVRGASPQTLIYSGRDARAGEKATLRLHDKCKAGDKVDKLDDAPALEQARKACERQIADIPFDAFLSLSLCNECTLFVTDGVNRASARCPSVQQALTRPLDDQSIRKSLSKTGGTPFTLRACSLAGDKGYLPASALNDLRRQALSALQSARENAAPARAPAVCALESKHPPIPEKRMLVARTFDEGDIAPFFQAGADAVIYAPRDYTRLPDLPAMQNVYLALPACGGDAENERIAACARAHGLGLACQNVGQLSFSSPCGMLSDIGVPVFNRASQAFITDRGCALHTLSPELSGAEMTALDPSRAMVRAYGRARLMLLSHCPMRVKMGLSKGREACGLCKQGKGCEGRTLVDRKGEQLLMLPVRGESGCVIELYAHAVTHLSARALDVGAHLLVAFTDETSAQKQRVLAHYRALLNGQTPAPLPGAYASGRFEDGVE